MLPINYILYNYNCRIQGFTLPVTAVLPQTAAALANAGSRRGRIFIHYRHECGERLHLVEYLLVLCK